MGFVSAGVVLAGVLWGLIWGFLTPGIEGRMVAPDRAVASGDGTVEFSAIGLYFSVALIAGVVLAVLFWMPPRFRGPAGVAGLAFGTIASGVVAVWIGDLVTRLRFPGRDGVAVGDEFTQPPSLRIHGAYLDFAGGIGFSWALLVVAPIAAMVTYVVFVVMNRSGDLGFPEESVPMKTPPARVGGPTAISDPPRSQ